MRLRLLVGLRVIRSYIIKLARTGYQCYSSPAKAYHMTRT